jgi:hypothetical protein
MHADRPWPGRGHAPRPTLTTQLAIALFGWQWRDDWACWCPPGWPTRDRINPPYLEKLDALKRHGADPRGRAATDEHGRPMLPDYRDDPEAADILWEWLHAQPGIRRVQFAPLPIPPDSLQGTRPWRCTIEVEPGLVVTGEGHFHREALCYAVLALATPSAVPGG